MGQQAEWREQAGAEGEWAGQLWQLAEEFDDTEAGRRRRLREKGVRLRLMGLAGEAAPEPESEDGIREERDISGPPEAYPKGVSPVTGVLHAGV